MIGRSYIPIALLVLIISLNGYYFFIHCGISPNDILSRICSEKTDPILTDPIYQDLVEEYEFLNSRIEEEKVIVFAGDSITKRFNINEFITSQHTILNRGIFSDTTYGLQNRIDTNINNLNLSKIFLMIGYNDIKYRTDDEIIENIKQIVRKLKHSEIYIQTILPVSASRKEENLRIANINNKLQQYCTVNNINFIDLHAIFSDNSCSIREDFTRDGVHPNLTGYKAWARHISQYIK